MESGIDEAFSWSLNVTGYPNGSRETFALIGSNTLASSTPEFARELVAVGSGPPFEALADVVVHTFSVDTSLAACMSRRSSIVHKDAHTTWRVNRR